MKNAPEKSVPRCFTYWIRFDSEILARAYGWNEDACELMLNAAPMHDVGKIGTPDQILLKPGKLNAEEWEIMKQHPAFGHHIIGSTPEGSHLFIMADKIAISHHEKWNGTGYPHGLSGREIPIEGRIVALADVFDALTSKRPYKDPWPVEETIEYMQKETGRHFDPELISLFVAQLPQIIEIRNKWKED